jgi:transcription elongation factor Elf1
MLRTRDRPSLDQRERDAARWRKWNEVRPWHLVCPSCEHEGTAVTTLKRLRASSIKCTACGNYLWRNTVTA